MKISTQTRYALRFLLELALHESDPMQTTKLTTLEIANRQGISEKYLESIASKLKKGEIILSSKGVNGGYSLAKPINEISLGNIMRLMESTYFKVHCVDDPSSCCPNYNGCILANVWANLEASLSNIADGISLEDMKNQSFNIFV